MRILLVDDHRLFVEAIASLLERHGSFEIVGQAFSGRHAVQLAAELNPDLVLMDIVMPELNGLDAARQILDARPVTRVLILSTFTEERYVLEAMRARMAGYLPKDCAAEELFRAIQLVMSGQIYLSPSVAGIVVNKVIKKEGPTADVFSTLSEREREILQLISEGHSTKQIAAQLTISIKTVETHRKRIMSKLQLFSVAELTKYAIREGLTGL